MATRLLRKLDWFINGKLLGRRYIKRRLKYFSMYLDTQTRGISKALCINGSREDDMIFLMQSYLKKGATVIDCGSNIGFYPLLEAQLIGAGGSIVCVEPDPRNYALLERNLDFIDKNVTVHKYNIAISSAQGEMDLFVGCASNLNKIVRNPDQSGTQSAETIRVRVDTIDALVSDLNIRPDFLRMDIEGHEVDVLKGMANTLRQAASGFTLLFELHPEEYGEKNSLADVLQEVRGCGFRCEAIVSAGSPNPKAYAERGYKPDKVIESDGRERGIYYNLPYDAAVALATAVPKASRYILLIKD